MNKQILITSALPYVNNIPHLGNIVGSTLSADVYARYQRKIGNRVLYICGSDQYGTCTEVKAIEEKMSCKDLCDKYHDIHQSIYKWFDISFDYFGKTTTQSQTKLTQEIFMDLWKNNHIESKIVVQLYCDGCERFVSDRYVHGMCYIAGCKGVVKGDQCDSCCNLIDITKMTKKWCSVCKQNPIEKSSKHLYLKLDNFTHILKKYFLPDSKSNKTVRYLSAVAENITKQWLSEGLESRCITRDLVWGTPFPKNTGYVELDEYQNKVFYVWFDAPIGYLSIIKEYLDNHFANSQMSIRMQDELNELKSISFENSDCLLARYSEKKALYESLFDWKTWVQTYCDDSRRWVQFMAKDNVVFHSIIFPSSLVGSNQNVGCGVTDISATDYLTYEGKKFSKGNNVGIFGDTVQKLSEKLGIDADYFRYYLIKIRPESHDSAFNMKEFVAVVKGELAQKIGNLVNRFLSLISKLSDSMVLDYQLEQIDELNQLHTKYINAFETFVFHDVIKVINRVAEIGNEYFQNNKLWEKMKDFETNKKLFANTALIIWYLSELLEPICPTKTNTIRQYIDIKANTYDEIYRAVNQSGSIRINNLNNISILFKIIRLEDCVIE